MGSVVGGDQMLPAFSLRQIADRWTFAPLATGLVIAAAILYLWGVWRVGSRHPARPWPWWRTWLFVCGLAVIVVATQSGIGTYDDVLFWDHMIQHLLLIMVAPALLVLGQPVTLLLHASRNPLHTWVKRAVRSRVAAFLTWPPFTIAAYAGTIVGTHLTSAMNVVMTNQLAHDAEHALYLIVGYLFFLPLLGREPIRWRIPYPLRILALIVVMPVDTFTGLVLGYSATGMTGMMSRSWGPSPVDDVHLGGAVMWIGGDAIMLVLIMVVFIAWSGDDRGTVGGLGWLDAVRRARLASLGSAAVAGSARSAPVAGAGTGGAGTGAILAGTASATPAGANAAPSVAGGSTSREGPPSRESPIRRGRVHRRGRATVTERSTVTEGPGASGSSVAEGVSVAQGTRVTVEQTASDDGAGLPGTGRHGTGRHGTGRHGDIDEDDEQLAAYNAYLARLSEAESGSSRPRQG